LHLRLPLVHARELLAELAEMPQVLNIERRPESSEAQPSAPGPSTLMGPSQTGSLGKN
jgi:hypothetical protein